MRYIQNCINYRRRWELENESLELLALEIDKPNSKPFVVLSVGIDHLIRLSSIFV